MQEMRAKVVDRLSGDGTLYPGLVPGGIWDRPLKAGQGAGATGSAFAIRPGDSARVPRLRESIVVFGPNDVAAPDGPQALGDLALRQGFLRLFTYAPATASGKAALDAIDARVRFLLHGWQTVLSHGYPVTFTELEALEAVDSEEFPGNIMTMRRYVGEFLRAA